MTPDFWPWGLSATEVERRLRFAMTELYRRDAGQGPSRPDAARDAAQGLQVLLDDAVFKLLVEAVRGERQ